MYFSQQDEEAIDSARSVETNRQRSSDSWVDRAYPRLEWVEPTLGLAPGCCRDRLWWRLLHIRCLSREVLVLFICSLLKIDITHLELKLRIWWILLFGSACIVLFEAFWACFLGSHPDFAGSRSICSGSSRCLIAFSFRNSY